MRPSRSKAAFISLPALLLGCALVVPILTVPALAQTAPAPAPVADGVDLPVPDLPAGLDRSLADVEPRRGVPIAASTRAADPGAILDGYAPLRPSALPASEPKGLPESSPKPAAETRAEPAKVQSAKIEPAKIEPAKIEPAKPESIKREPAKVEAARPQSIEIEPIGTVTPAARSTVAALAPAPAGTAPVARPPVAPPVMASAPQIRRGADDVQVPPTPGASPMPAAAPAAAVPPAPASAAPAAAAPTAATPSAPADTTTAAGLDAAALRKALDVFVGNPPASVAGRVNAEDLARFKTRQEISAFYAARADAPLWVEDGRFGARARAVLSRIDHAAEDGLDLKDVPVEVPHGTADAAELARAELSLTRAAVAYGSQATGGRVDPVRLAPLIVAKPDVTDATRVLTALAAAPDAGEALRALNPPQKGYAALRDKLAELRRSNDMADRDRIPYGPILKLGMRDKRVPLIRARFGLDIPPAGSAPAGSDEATDLVYDTQVAAAVADFQRAHHLPASGILTIRTVGALGGGIGSMEPRALENEIVANMERWRWLPRDMGANHIEVNIPDFSLDVLHGDDVVHHTRVVVGQPDKPTPVFSQTMQFIIVNPYWNVPLSIVKKEMMPKLAADPNYFANHGYETIERDGVTYVRQPPGDANALGRIKFMFPNKYAVYLHDTNARALFGKSERALSHGCVRVEAPFKLAEAVLGRDHGWTEARVKKLIGGEERTIMLPEPLPIHIVYFTAFVDQAGDLKLRDDVYGYSAKLKAALGLDG